MIVARMLALILMVQPVSAGGTLDGLVVRLNVMTYDDPAAPFFESRGRTVTVGPGVEFGMGPEFNTQGFDVVPVQVEIGPQRIEFSYGAARGLFFDAPFNGYVLRFDADCALFEAVRIDLAATTMPVTPEDIRTSGGALFVNVAGRSYGPDATLALDFTVGDCLLG